MAREVEKLGFDVTFDFWIAQKLLSVVMMVPRTSKPTADIARAVRSELEMVHELKNAVVRPPLTRNPVCD